MQVKTKEDSGGKYGSCAREGMEEMAEWTLTECDLTGAAVLTQGSPTLNQLFISFHPDN